MKLLVDARCLQDSSYAKRGIGRHSAGLLRHARRFLPGPLEIVGLLDPAMNEPSAEHARLFDHFQRHATPPDRSDGPAIFLQLSPMTHPANRIATFLCRDDILSVEVFYDLVPLDDPLLYLDGIGARQSYLGNFAWLRNYRLHAPISRHSRACLTDRLDIPDSSIAVTGACLRDVFAKFNPAAVPSMPRSCNFAPGEYFIMVGGEDPRKNTDKVLAAQTQLTQQGIRTKLLIVGLYAPRVMNPLLQEHRELGGHPRDVQFLYGVNDEELTSLYYHSKACLCPSSNEGFSLPIVEAMACRAPVLAAGSAAQAELVEQPEALFDPSDVNAIAAAMARVLREPAFRSDLMNKQSRVAPRYVEEEVASRLWMLVRRHWPTPERIPVSSRGTRRGRPHLAFLTPYPSRDETNIGYLPAMLRTLSESIDITVYSDQNDPRRDPWIKSFQPLSSMPYLSHEFDRIVAVLGLSSEMRRYFWLAERFGGACLLFASHLGPLYAETLGLERARALVQRMQQREVSFEEVNASLDDPGHSGTRFVDEVARWADPLVVHSRLVQNEAGRHDSAEFLPPCFTAALHDDDLISESRQDARRRLGFRSNGIHILAIDIEREADATMAIHSLEQLRAWNVAAELHLAVDGDSRIRDAIRRATERLNVGPFVHDLDGPVTNAHLQAVDLGLCLSAVETVSVPTRLFRMLGAGIPTVVNRELARGFELLPLAMEVPDIPSPVLIAEQWLSAIQSGRHQQRLTPERRRFVDERQPERYARTLLHLLKVA